MQSNDNTSGQNHQESTHLPVHGTPAQQPDTPRPGHTAPATSGLYRTHTTLGLAA
ncbi:hypothetical protein ABT010_33565 [Streptomyces sp. NPDC002668]|uniref:hypothetical protein n=1 Tax=Streptomyces sp. NPDC002668 TaxID=3154422 RepID=UPI00331E25E6